MQQFNMEQKEKYKETELGLLPESWKVVKVSSICKTQAGGTPSTFKEEYWNGDIPWINSGALKNAIIKTPSKFITKLGLDNSNTKLWPKNTVVIALTGATTGMVGLLNFNCSANQSVVGILPNEKFDSFYLFYNLVNSRERILGFCSGAAQPHINKGIVDDFITLIPPITEQNKISYILSTIQEAKEKTENVINSLKELKKSMMKHLFTYGPVSLEEAEKVKLKETEIGEVPEGWKVNNIGELYNVKQGKQISAKESKEGKIKKPFLRTSNLTWGKINISKVDSMYFTKEKFEKLKLKKGDILTCEGGDIGRTAIYDDELEECAYQNHLHRLRPKTDDTNNLFFVCWMNHAVNQRKLYVFDANRTTIPNLSGSRLKNFNIPKPELSKQQQISSILSTIDAKIESEENRKNAIEVLFKSMLHNLMTTKIRVNNLEI